ncbi:hypothetical protein ES703_35118 [subsurface metagenome]
MLTAKLILERLDKEGRLLERRERLSRSFTVQLIDFLYLKHAQANRATRDIDNTLRTLNYNPAYAQFNLEVGSPGGHAGCARVYFTKYRDLEGQDVGIQVGIGDTAVTPTDHKMEDRVEHGRCGQSGAKADFLNPSFEAGDLTSWTPASSANMEAIARTDAWAIRDGTYYCALWTTAHWDVGDYAQVSQDIDLTNISHLRFQLRGEGTYSSYFRFEVYVGGRPVYWKELATNTDYPNQLADVCAYTGVHTVTFKCVVKAALSGGAGHGAWIDNIETIQADPEIEYGGTEVLSPIFGTLDHNGEFTIRRYFTNNSGLSITVNEVGIQAVGESTGFVAYAFLIARDVVAPGVAVANGEILRVTYVPQITV